MDRELRESKEFSDAIVLWDRTAPFLLVEEDEEGTRKFIAVFTDKLLIEPFVKALKLEDYGLAQIGDATVFLAQVKTRAKLAGWDLHIKLNPFFSENGEINYSIIDPILNSDMAQA